jgi:type IV pilus assembly protein PilM
MALSLRNIMNRFTTGDGAQSAIGIDIGSSSVKVVELKKEESYLQLSTYGELQLGPYAGAALGETVRLTPEQQTEAVVDLLREARATTRFGTIAIPLTSSFITTVAMSSDSPEAIANRVPVEAKKFIPLSLSEVTLDWSELPPAAGDDDSQREVLLVAIENGVVENYAKLQQVIGMSTQPSEIEVFSLMRSLSRPEEGPIAIVDCGAQTTKLYIARDVALQRTHRKVRGGMQITRRVAELLSVPFAEAESVKRVTTIDGAHAADVQRATDSVLSDVLQEFRRVIDTYEAKQEQPLARVVCTGGVASSPFFKPLARTVLGREVEIANPFDRVAYPAFMEDTLQSIAPTFGVSLGAAVRVLES